MAVKTFYYSQLSNLMVEGVGIHASFSINLTVKDENIPSGKKYISPPQVNVMLQRQQEVAAFCFGVKLKTPSIIRLTILIGKEVNTSLWGSMISSLAPLSFKFKIKA